jgi:N-acylneuraminate cytidylyltransferase
MNAICFIFARGGSKGLPNKNIRFFCGKPLIAWSIECALSIPEIREVIVSTDSEEIAEVSRSFGAKTPFIRPHYLGTDQSPEWLSWQHAINFIKDERGELPDLMISTPATSPLRLPIDIKNLICEYKKGCDAVVSITEADRNPYFNLVKYVDQDYINLWAVGEKCITRRQDAPKIFDITTVAYAVRPSYVIENSSLFNGRIRANYVPKERAIDIDTIFDFEIAEFLFSRRLKTWPV